MLTYSRVDADCIRLLRPYFDCQTSRNCDYTIGVVYMWRDFFHTEYALADHMLFLRMRDDHGNIFHLLPIGCGDMQKALHTLVDSTDTCLRFSAVTEEQLLLLADIFGIPAQLIEDRRWADYIYDREKLSTYAGKKLSGQRNHVNRFMKEHGSFIYEPITSANIDEARAFLYLHKAEQGKDDPVALKEYDYTLDTLDYFDELHYTGALLKLPDGTPCAMSLGETVGDTLYVHAEKALRSVHGASQLICREYAAHAEPHVKYVNREDDMGDEGLRYAKMSLHPSILLMKHTVIYCIK